MQYLRTLNFNSFFKLTFTLASVASGRNELAQAMFTRDMRRYLLEIFDVR